MDDGKLHMDFFRFLFIISIYDEDVLVVVAQQKRGFLGAETSSSSSSSLGFSQQGGREFKTVFKEQRVGDGRIKHMEILASPSSSGYMMFLLL